MSSTYARDAQKLAIVLAMALAASACHQETDQQSAPREVAEVVDPKTVGAVRITVTTRVEVAAAEPLEMRGSAVCASLHNGPVADPSLRTTEGRVADTVVYIEGAVARQYVPSQEAVVIDQRGCLYEPRVVGAMVGQPIEFLNSDPEPHNVHGTPEHSSGWNIMMAQQDSKHRRTFDAPEIGIKIGCDIHPWMRAYLSVFAHPHFAVTGSTGESTLATVPAGDYTLRTWHERLGATQQPVHVEAGKETRVTVDLQVP